MSHVHTPSATGSANFYIPSLDGIRACAVLLVFSAHAGLNDRVPGNFGVTVFFFLSGFLITTLMRLEFDRSGRVSLPAFYSRRALRILPPMYIVLSAATLLTLGGLLAGSVTLSGLAAQALHLSNYYIIFNGWWDGRAPGTWIYWSLAVEEHFYLAFPFIYVVLRRHLLAKRQQLVLIGLCVLVLAWRLILAFLLDAPKDRLYVATDTRVDSILFGCALAVYGNPVLDTIRGSSRWWKFVWLPAGVAGLLVSFIVRGFEFEQTWRYTLQGICLVPLFVVAMRYPDWTICRVLNLRWVKYIGVLSYSFYLLHPTVLFALDQWTTWPAPVRALLGLTVSLAIAAAIHAGVERPLAARRKRLSRVASTQTQTSSPRQPSIDANLIPQHISPQLLGSKGTSNGCLSPALSARATDPT